MHPNSEATVSGEAHCARKRPELEVLFREVQRIGRIGSWDSDLASGRLEWTEEVYRIFGVEPGKFLPSNDAFLRAVHPEDRSLVLEAASRAIQTGVYRETDFRIVRPDGQVRHVSQQANLVRDEAGRVARLLGTVQDITERKQAEARLRACIEITPYVAIQWYDEHGRVVFWNPASEKIFGWKAEEALGRTLDELIQTKEEAAAFADLLQEIKRTGQTAGPAEYRFHRKDGSMGICLSTVFPIPAEGGQARFVCMDVDMTAQRRAEEELRASEARLRAIFATEPECVKLLAADGSLLEMNPAGLRMIQADTLEQVRNRCVYPLVVEEHRAAFRQLTERVFLGESGVLEFQITGLKGGTLWLETHATPLRDERGRVTGLLSVSRDITARKLAEENLREKQRMLEAAQAAGRVGLWFSEPEEGGKLIWSEGTCHIFGLTPEQFDGRVETFFKLIHPDDLAAVREASRAAIKGERAYQVRHRIIRADGSVRWVEEHAEVERDANGRALRMMGVVRDITEEHRADALLAAEKEVLEMIASGAPLPDILETIVQQMEVQSEGGIGSVLLLDEDGVHLRHGAAPHLPAAYQSAVDGVTIGPDVGSCGTAAFRRELVIVEDIATDPLWASCRELALAHGLRACWSTPVFSSSGQVLATFAVYYRQPRRPSAEEMEWVSRATHLAGIAIERKRDEARLLRSRADQERAQSVGHIGSWVSEAGESGRVIWSDEMHRIAGLEPGQFAATKAAWLERVHPADLPAVQAAARAAWSGERPYNFDHRIIRPDGTVRWVHQYGELERDAAGRPVRMIGVTQDITSRRLAEENVRKLAAFPQLNPNPVFELAGDGSMKYCNAAATRLAQELGLGHATELLPPETPGIVAECLAENRSRLRLERPLNQRILSWSFYPMAELGVVHCYAGDVTERHELEARFRQAQKLESVGRLAAGVAHDFNNLLTVIQGNASLLLEQQAVPEPLRACLEGIDEATVRASKLTRQLLLFSRKQRLEPRILDLNELTSNLTRMLARLLGEDVKLEFSYETALPPVQADPGMIEQVIVNLVVNARDAMPGGGTLRIATAVIELAAGQTGMNPDAAPGTFVQLSVTDTGSGIPPEILPHIFEPFFTTKEIGKGTGLGLATVYGIIKQHGGWVEVSSTPGLGAEFRIFLPAARPEIGLPQKRDAHAAIEGGAETILLVEDEPDVRDIIEKTLALRGYHVLSAPSGPAALQISRKYPDVIHLLLTDLVMPEGMNGHELAVALRRERPGIQVIYSSGYSPEIVSGRIKVESDDSFLQKPYPSDELLRFVRRKLDQVGTASVAVPVTTD